MDHDEIKQIRTLLEYEAQRTAPPRGFPRLPAIPPERYYDPSFYALEQEQVFHKSWLLAAHLDELPEPGCFIRWDKANQPVIIVHDKNEGIQAFFNICSHRGAPVIKEQSGKKSRFSCGYHGWTYKTNGELIAVTHKENFFEPDLSCLGLKPIRCEQLGNFIFVNFDENAAPLRQSLGNLVQDWEEFRFDELRLANRFCFDLECNWKIGVEANSEVYHVPFIHTSILSRQVDERRSLNILYPDGHSRIVMARRSDIDIGQTIVELDPNWQIIPGLSELALEQLQGWSLFPNALILTNPMFVAPLVFWPTGPNSCRIETWTTALDWGEGQRPDIWTEGYGEKLGETLREDYENAAQMQRSMISGHSRGVTLSYQESRIYYNHQTLDQRIGVDKIPAHLRVEKVLGTEWIYPNDPRVSQMEG